MPYRLRVDPVVSSSRLSGALSPGRAADHGEYDRAEGVLSVEDAETAERLASDHHNVSLVDEAAAPDSGESEPSEGPPTCAGKDGECSREVDEPGGYCWQHAEG